jgi:hypothetical protein
MQAEKSAGTVELAIAGSSEFVALASTGTIV